VWGVGFECIDLEAATEQGVLVLTTPGANAEHVADFALALMLACLRRLFEVDAAVRSGAWRLPVLGADLAGATVGLVALGQIGRAVARRLRGFDCRVLAVEPDRTDTSAVGGPWRSARSKSCCRRSTSSPSTRRSRRRAGG